MVTIRVKRGMSSLLTTKFGWFVKAKLIHVEELESMWVDLYQLFKSKR